jgi:hypothetical protein
MKVYGGVDVWTHVFLTSTLAGGEWSASWPGRFTHGERARRTHWIGGWVGTAAGLDDVKERKFLTLPELKLRPLGRPARSQLEPCRQKSHLSSYTILSNLLLRDAKENIIRNTPDIFTTVKIYDVFCFMTSCSLVWGHKRLWETYCLPFPRLKNRIWRQYVPPKRL